MTKSAPSNNNDNQLNSNSSLPLILQNRSELEDAIVKTSQGYIKNSQKLKDGLHYLDRNLDVFIKIVRDYKPKNDDDLTLFCLGARLVNDITASFSLILRGYYQVALACMRDIIEISFLIDYLRTNRDQISIWKSADDKQHRDLFSPSKIREKLDHRDGASGQDRRDYYKSFCKYAAHASYEGMKLMSQNELLNVGNFFSDTFFKMSIWELVRAAGMSSRYFALLFKLNKEFKDYEYHLLSLTLAWIKNNRS